MKITLLIGCLTGGGAERVVCNLANHLAAHNHDVDVLIVANDITYKPNSNVNVISMSGESGTYFVPKTIINLWRLYKFNRYLRNQKRDLYVTFLPKLSIMLMQQGRFFKAPVVLAERSNPEKFCSRSKENDTNFLKYYSKADGYVFRLTMHVLTMTSEVLTLVIQQSYRMLSMRLLYWNHTQVRERKLLSAWVA